MTDRLKGQAPDNSLIRANPTLRSPKSRETATWHDSIIIYFIRIVNVQFDLYDCAQGRSWQMLGNHIVARVWASAGIAFTVGYMHAICSPRGTKYAIFEKL